ncbi:MAG: hypothetical protein C0594_08260, partial [Marinilabiliales bacterium]
MEKHKTFLVAKCRTCGALVELDFTRDPVCEACNDTNPLDGEIKDKFFSIQKAIKQSSYIAKQKTDKILRLVRDFSVSGALIGFGIWILVIAYFIWIYFESGIKINSWGTFLSEKLQKQELFVLDSVSLWWLVYILANGILLTYIIYNIVLLQLKKSFSLAAPILSPIEGQLPLCRCCASELPSKGLVRKCEACGAENIVTGKLHRKAQHNLTDQMSILLKESRTSMADRLKRIRRFERFAMAIPVLLGLISPFVVNFIPVTIPVLWFTGLGLVLLAFMFTGLNISRKTPKVKKTQEATRFSEINTGTKIELKNKIAIIDKYFYFWLKNKQRVSVFAFLKMEDADATAQFDYNDSGKLFARL